MNAKRMMWRLGMGAILILAANVYADRDGGNGGAAPRGRDGGGREVSRDSRHGESDRHGGPEYRRPAGGGSASYRGDGFSISFSIGNRWPQPHPRDVWHGRPCLPMPRYCPPRPRPVIRYLGCDLRMYQPGIHGHPVLIQRWCPRRREWITIETRPSLEY